MKLRDQINALLRQRKEQLDALEALSNKAAGSDEHEARLFTTDEQKEFDKIKAGIADIDQTLSRLEEAERQLAAGARPAPHPLDPTPAVEPKTLQAIHRPGVYALRDGAGLLEGQPGAGRRNRQAVA